LKKLLIAIALAVVLILAMVAPIFADAPPTGMTSSGTVNVTPTLVFDTGMTKDGATLAGLNGTPAQGNLASGYLIYTTGNPITPAHVLGLTGTTSAPALADGMYPFYLSPASGQIGTLDAYFAAKGWTTPTWLPAIQSEVAGSTAFFYLNAVGGVYSLVDGFKLNTLGLPAASATLTIDDDYPVGTYTYNGTLTGNNTATQAVLVSLKVIRLNDYTLSSTTVAFGSQNPASVAPGGSFTMQDNDITVTNIGVNDITGYTISNINNVPAGLTGLAITAVGSTTGITGVPPLTTGNTETLYFVLQATVALNVTSSIDLSGLTFTLTPH
jgi:hypothetical protein